MAVSDCPLCGEEFRCGFDGDDPFTSISVNHHDDGERTDFSESVCPTCGDELLAELYEARGGD